MATEIKMPKLGMTMEEGKLLEWARKEKNLVKKGEVLLTIESDKVTFEVESPGDGLLLILVAGGEGIPVGEILAYLADSEEEYARIRSAGRAAAPAEPTGERAAPGLSPGAPAAREGAVRATPAAREAARQKGVDLSTIAGTGPQGRITREDVLAALEVGPQGTGQGRTDVRDADGDFEKHDGEPAEQRPDDRILRVGCLRVAPPARPHQRGGDEERVQGDRPGDDGGPVSPRPEGDARFQRFRRGREGSLVAECEHRRRSGGPRRAGRSGAPRRGPDVAGGGSPGIGGPCREGPAEEAASGGDFGGNLHADQPRQLRRGGGDGHHQPARGCNPGDREGVEEAGRGRGPDRGSQEDAREPHGRPPPHRWRDLGALPANDEGTGGEPGTSLGSDLAVANSSSGREMGTEGKRVVVIGGGPGGYPAAIRAAQLVLDVVLIDRGGLGGACLHRGCIPTKLLLKETSDYRKAATFTSAWAGLAIPAADVDGMMRRKAQVVGQLERGTRGLLRKNGVRVVAGTASFIDPSRVLVAETGEVVLSSTFIVATGSAPARLP